MYISTRRTKLCVVATAMSIAACTCAVAVPSSALAQTEEAAPIVSARSADSVPVTGTQPGASSTTTPANQSSPATAQPAADNADDSLTWTKDDFNISADGKTIGLTGINKTNGDPGLNAKGIAKLKKNHHLVIPDGVEVILNNSFIGHKTDDTFIEGITLPDSLKVIEDGAFAWQKIKGTVVIPKNVIAVHPAAFLGNEIEKVVFKSTLAETGKRNSTDDDAYYLAGLGNRAFQGNKIKEIEFTGKLTSYKFHVDSNEKQNPDAAPFSNQELDEITLTVGDEFKMPVTIKQNGNDYKILNMVLAGDKNNHGSLVDSGFFKEENGKIVAFKAGSIQTQCLFYDTVNQFRPVGTVAVTYKIVPKPKIYTVTFVNDTDQHYAKVQVKEKKSIKDKSVVGQAMPVQPSKDGFTFKGWNTQSDGTGTPFDDSTPVSGDITVYAQYEKVPSPKPQPQPNPEPKPQPNPELKPQPAPAPVPAPDPTPAPVPGPTPAPAPNMNPELQQEEPGRTPHVTPPASEPPAPIPSDAPATEPPARPAGEQHLQQARMPRTSDMALLGMLASVGAIACAVVCGAITALKRRQ